MAHPDMDRLLDEGLNVAIDFLEKRGEFYPFGVTMASDGIVAYSQGYTGDECPPSQEIIDLLMQGFQSGAESGKYKSIALIADVSISLDGQTQSEAISVTIEHADCMPVTCYLPYTKKDGTFNFSEIMAEQAERRVFIASSKNH